MNFTSPGPRSKRRPRGGGSALRTPWGRRPSAAIFMGRNVERICRWFGRIMGYIYIYTIYIYIDYIYIYIIIHIYIVYYICTVCILYIYIYIHNMWCLNIFLYATRCHHYCNVAGNPPGPICAIDCLVGDDHPFTIHGIQECSFYHILPFKHGWSWMFIPKHVNIC